VGGGVVGSSGGVVGSSGGVVGSSGGVVGSSGGELGMLNRFSMLNRVNGSHLRNELDGGALGACGDKQASNDSQGANSVAEGLHDLFARGRVLDIFNACSVSHFDMVSCDRGHSSGAWKLRGECCES
jgi:hypothetical protein